MNTFGSDVSQILSAREKEHATVGVTVGVPVIKADSIKKVEPEKETAEPEKETTEPEKETAEPEKESEE